ncbi:MAG TPA: hypothetical protein EYH44_02405 [Thermoprotei archaeon]|nr:hypothetical protein [Thermoprotei archaeon]
MDYRVVLVDIDVLKLHEYTDLETLTKLFKDIVGRGILIYPIVADRKTNIVLDGAHRVTVLKLVGCKYVPTIYVDYSDSDIVVESWRKDIKFDKNDVIRAGLTDDKLPPKSTRHMIKIGDDYQHITYIQKRVDIPIKNLLPQEASTILEDLDNIHRM